MQQKAEARLGNVVVTFLSGNFLFRDARDPTRIVSVEEAAAVDLIGFLHQHSQTAKDKLGVKIRSGPSQT